MRALAALVVGLVVLMPVSLGAWGMEVHRLITARAIEGLPAEMQPFFAPHKAFIAEHSVDPDLWRIVDLRGAMGEEDPNHFLDIDGFDEPAPFSGVPRDFDAYVKKYGAEKANRYGRLPWRVAEMHARLVGLFQDVGKGTPAFAADNARYVVAVMAHYVEDAHQPFHASLNYDGQATNQRGIHSRFETELVMRNIKTLTLAPVTIKPIPDARDFIFETLVAGQALVDQVLAADRQAATGRELYDDAYFAAFLKGARPVVERRLSEAASGVASLVVSAWDKAGRPKLPEGGPRPPARIRR